MNKPLKLIPIGNSTGVILPKDVLSELGVSEGDTIIYIEAPDGIELRTAYGDLDSQMEVARQVMRRGRKALLRAGEIVIGWIWVADAVALAMHREQIAEHGGDGVRDFGLFESAMARALNLAVYGDPEVAEFGGELCVWDCAKSSFR